MRMYVLGYTVWFRKKRQEKKTSLGGCFLIGVLACLLTACPVFVCTHTHIHTHSLSLYLLLPHWPATNLSALSTFSVKVDSSHPPFQRARYVRFMGLWWREAKAGTLLDLALAELFAHGLQTSGRGPFTYLSSSSLSPPSLGQRKMQHP